MQNSVLEAKALILQHALCESRDSIMHFKALLHGRQSATESLANLVKIERFIDVMSEVPAILFIQARTGHEWMSEEIKTRFTPEFVALVDEVGELYFNSKRSEPMQPIGMCWFVAKEICENG